MESVPVVPGCFIKLHRRYACVLYGIRRNRKRAVGITVIDAIREWVKNVNRHRSAQAIASMCAAAFCSSLEGFLRAMVDHTVDQGVVDRVSRTYSRPTRSGQQERLSLRLEAARVQLDQWVKPSGGAGFSEWMRLLSALFRVSAPEPVQAVLKDLIGFPAHDSGIRDSYRWTMRSPAPGGSSIQCLGTINDNAGNDCGMSVGRSHARHCAGMSKLRFMMVQHAAHV